ncbi:hypothetical protein GF359_10000 [candidate division WOR-3 bacterium]|uniref:Uncharacterized protein n=1 Tax=candidate division WOR-3 bacterium TaxID=2052148 RepID=A0A9D5QDA2_UNCW3|nr:hypothetical protein [candidate division WOR-3 bacterium]MBD3365533.1 hypothetical protein [candidate division WOR-3 bacterium]
MGFAILSLLFGQYAGVYVPHSPLHVEQGTVITTGSADIEFTYRTPTDTFIGVPVISCFGFSFDGYNEIGTTLPWLRLSKELDTTSRLPVYLGNLGLYYKRNIIGSHKYGYLAGKVFAEFPTSLDTYGIKDSLGGARSLYGIGFSYTFEFPILPEYHDLFGRLPVIGSISLEDAFLSRVTSKDTVNDTEEKQWVADFPSGFGWGISAEILPLDYLYVGAAIQGGANLDPEYPEGINFTPYIGLRMYWWEIAASYRMGEENRIELSGRIYL